MVCFVLGQSPSIEKNVQNSVNTPVEQLVDDLQKQLWKVLSDHVPPQFSSTSLGQPWFNTKTKRAVSRKKRTYKRVRHTGKERDWTVVNRLKKETKNICRQALGVVCSFLFVWLSTIRAESVGPLRRIYQRFSPLPIFNVDPHYAGTATPLLSATLRQGVRRGNSILGLFLEFGITMPSHNGQKLHFSAVKG